MCIQWGKPLFYILCFKVIFLVVQFKFNDLRVVDMVTTLGCEMMDFWEGENGNLI